MKQEAVKQGCETGEYETGEQKTRESQKIMGEKKAAGRFRSLSIFLVVMT